MDKVAHIFKIGSKGEGKSLNNRHERAVEEARRLSHLSAELLKLAQQFRGSSILA